MLCLNHDLAIPLKAQDHCRLTLLAVHSAHSCTRSNGYLRTVITHAAAIHGTTVSLESVDLACIALKRLGLIGKSLKRNRRPNC
jgi:hypothetical protein